MHDDLLKKRIRDCIQDLSQPLWFPNLTKQLSEAGWKSLKTEFGLEPSNYSTTRILANQIDASISTLPYKSLPFSIELLPKSLEDKYSDSQFRFYNDKELSTLPILDCLAEAIDLIKQVPTLWGSIFELVNSLHLLKPNDDAFDVSFSEPRLTFSIFVSVPKSRLKTDYLRVAEEIVHEAMHLQLSLLENLVPLTLKNEVKVYSPWKNEHRNSTGILHGLYVFRVIDSFYADLNSQEIQSSADFAFTRKRRIEILDQFKKIRGFAKSSELTDCGSQFVNRMLRQEILDH